MLSFALPTFLAAEQQIPLNAEPLFKGSEGSLFAVATNSVLVAFIVTALIVWAARAATAKMELVPNQSGQNMFEAIVELLYNMLEGIVGKHMVAKAFPLLATFFIFILVGNLFGLVPGVGTIGFGEKNGPLSLGTMEAPLLRPANADLNMTLGMALLFMILWFYWTIQEIGILGFLEHTFAPKGGLKGPLALALTPIFWFVGLIEVVSILFRPVSLSLRLFGNIYAGENLLHTMSHLGQVMGLPNFVCIVMSILVPVPFYFLELLVAFVQALVFTLLCAVYLQLSTSHEGESHDDEHARGEDAAKAGAPGAAHTH